ncbi:MAG: bifunctional diaminohydroxyphosphoribosylaminopyrimidine deaminase/5-amino-6-(5-phosphoribosylamino)uracil reductase RibD [Gammaproteobacteria bacterium]|nr:bifunctional diaminohydroxyphosphoribosylaminopyrimidine deaminase/5-amino-6-(5-phosphoribosylamino)uracil reductase RibD [Gammaproteobacteria bacterium]
MSNESQVEFSNFDRDCMVQAIRAAVRGVTTTHPNPRVGCVIARDGQVVSEGFHERAGEAHAEINALNEARDAAQEATVYVTLEPCSHHGRTGPCADALIDAGVRRVVVAMVDPNPQVAGEGIRKLREAGIQVDVGLLETESRRLNPGFIKRMATGRPFVRVKIAASLDGRTAMASGESQWITGKVARADVQHWRSTASGVLTGVGTVLADDPSLNVRLDNVQRQPERIIVDSSLRTPANAKTLGLDGDVRIFHAEENANAAPLLEAAGATLSRLPKNAAGKVDLGLMLDQLGDLEHNEIWVEAGAALTGALLADDLVDEILLYQAPVFLGHEAKPLAELHGLEKLEDRLRFAVSDVSQVGNDLRMTLVPASRVKQKESA